MTLLHLLHKRDQLAAELKNLDREIDAEVSTYSRKQGYRMTLRREQVRRELSHG